MALSLTSQLCGLCWAAIFPLNLSQTLNGIIIVPVNDSACSLSVKNRVKCGQVLKH